MNCVGIGCVSANKQNTQLTRAGMQKKRGQSYRFSDQEFL